MCTSAQLTPGLVIEELLSAPSAAGLAEDLKCFTFGGTTRYLLHVRHRFDGQKHDTVFDRQGQLLEITVRGSQVHCPVPACGH